MPSPSFRILTLTEHPSADRSRYRPHRLVHLAVFDDTQAMHRIAIAVRVFSHQRGLLEARQSRGVATRVAYAQRLRRIQ